MLRSDLRASATPLPARPAPPPPPPVEPAPAGPLDTTLILGPGQEPLDLDPEPPSQWNDLDTVIRPDPAALAPARAVPPASIARKVPPPAPRAARPPTPPAPVTPPPRPRLDAPRPPEPRRVDAPPRTLTEPRARVVYRTPNHVHLAYVAACFATLLVGLGFGVLIARNRAAGAPPSVEIRAPAGYSASVNGAALAGPAPWNATLTADAPAVVRVQGPGYGPVEARVQMKLNEVRVLDFTPPALSKVP